MTLRTQWSHCKELIRVGRDIVCTGAAVQLSVTVTTRDPNCERIADLKRLCG